MKTVVILSGGLGNQILQLAEAKRASSSIFLIDLLYALPDFPGFMRTKRTCHLKSYSDQSIKVSFVKSFWVQIMIIFLMLPFKIFHRIKKIDATLTIFQYRIIWGYFLTIDPLKMKVISQLNMSKILGVSFDEKVFQEKNNRCSSLGFLHIRGGDFLKEGSGYRRLTPMYYERGVSLLNLSEAVVFTDDRSYAEQVLKGLSLNYQFFEDWMETDLLTEFFCLTLFQKGVSSNSSFCQIASLINYKNQIKKVVIPSGPNNLEVQFELLPSEWRVI